MIKMAKSDITLKIPLALEAALPSRQCPVVIKGFQNFSRGLHWKMSMNILTK